MDSGKEHLILNGRATEIEGNLRPCLPPAVSWEGYVGARLGGGGTSLPPDQNRGGSIRSEVCSVGPFRKLDSPFPKPTCQNHEFDPNVVSVFRVHFLFSEVLATLSSPFKSARETSELELSETATPPSFQGGSVRSSRLEPLERKPPRSGVGFSFALVLLG